MKVHVYLPSGDGCSIEVSPATPISNLKDAAQQHFQRPLQLTAKGQQLDLTATLSEVGLRDEDVVTAVVRLGKLAATDAAFALYGLEGKVVTWGVVDNGGDSSQVQEQLANVQHIQATVLESGAVVTWGNPDCGGDNSRVQEQLRKVQHIQATDPECGGESSEVQEQLRNVQHIQATRGGFRCHS